LQIALDVAASEFATEEKPCRYDLHKKAGGEGGKKTGDELLALYRSLAAKYPIISIEASGGG
jgi:enolase